ncbi:MAG: esterase [Phycisphaerales bacterium]|nr:esterase [Phycisphaerales bacterium]
MYAPANATTTPAPLVFAFHGHGGSSRQFARSSAFHKAWPEAIVVYPQGLPTAGMTDPKGEKAGWQNRFGAGADRDLKFFDAMLAGLKSSFQVDDRRIYSTGHSNGGGFTYLLWSQRGEVFAALGPSAAGTVGTRGERFAPRPLIHIAGESDTVVPVAFQQRTLTAARSLNGCDAEGQPWAKNCTQYPSKSGTPVVICLQPGEHKYYEHATELIVRFFKEHALPATSATPAAPAAP